MNRKQKIIVSVTGIFLVLLIIVGLTYAYFLTQIKGNTNNKSISVTTANLSLKYDDGSGVLTSSSKLVPNTTVAEKTFSVENTGDATVDNYAVILEDLKVTNATDNTLTYFEYPNDFKLKINCSSSKSTKVCNGYDDVMPSTNDILFVNSIDEGEIQTYTLSLTYIDSGIDQSKDMNKILEAKLDIIDINGTVDVEGTVTNYSAGDYVQVNSEPKISYLNKDGKYKVVGLKPDDHKVSIFNISNTTTESSSINMTITKGTEASVSGSNIKITDESRTLTINVDAKSKTYDISEEIGQYNPYSKNKSSLAYNIINNSLLAKNNTRFVMTPPSKVAGETNSYDWEYGEEMYVPFSSDLYINAVSSDPSKTSADFDECLYGIWDDETGETTPGDCTGIDTLNTSCENAIGKYIFDDMYWKVYGPVDACVDDVPMKRVYPESVLSVADDDYGTSYYYRGNVKDNYLNFAGMCFRVVRIQGDGSIKLILEDRYSTCDSDSFTGDWSLGDADFGINYKNISTTGTFYVNSYNYLSTSSSAMKYKLTSWLSGTGINTEKLKNETWCLGDESNLYDYKTGALLTDSIESLTMSNLQYGQFAYEAYKRLKGLGQTPEATLKCGNGDNTTGFVGALTADEVAYAGAKYNESNYAYYLKGVYDSGYDLYSWWTLTPGHRRYQSSASEDDMFVMAYDGSLSVRTICSLTTCRPTSGGTTGSRTLDSRVRPAITLKKDTVIASGDGTQSNPYVVN